MPTLKEQGEGASGLRAVLIAGIRGYTPYTMQRGDAAASDLVRRFQARVREAVGDQAEVLRFQKGDEVLGIFASARTALQTAVAIRRRLQEDRERDEYVPVGIGLSCGEISYTGDNYEGAAIILASRLCGIAAAGEAIASESIVAAAGETPGIRTVLQTPRYLKGVDQPLQPSLVVGEDEPGERSWLQRVLEAIAEYQEQNERDYATGITVGWNRLHHTMGADPASEEGIAVSSALQQAMESKLAVRWGDSNVRLTPTGWQVAGGRVPGSDRDPEILRAAVEAWRDDAVDKPQGNWISMIDVFKRAALPWDISAAGNAAERLEHRGFVATETMSQDVWVRPTGAALAAVPQSPDAPGQPADG